MKLPFSYCIFFILIVQHTSVWGQGRTTDDYLQLYREKTLGCARGVHCCLRRAHCLIDLYRTIAKDSGNHKNYRFYKASAMNTVEHFTQLGQKLRSDFIRSDCPTNIQLAFDRFYRNYEYLGNPFEMFKKKLHDSSDMATELFDALSINISLYENVVNLQCNKQVIEDSNTLPTLNDVDYFAGLTSNAVDTKDYFAAKIYTSQFISRVQEPKRKVAGMKVLGDIMMNLDDVPLAIRHYTDSANLAAKENLVGSEIEAQIALAAVLFQQNELEKALLIYQHLANLYLQKDNPIKQATLSMSIARILNKLNRQTEVEPLLKNAFRVFEQHKDWSKLAEIRYFRIAFLIDNYHYQQACIALNEFKQLLKEHKLTADKKIFNLKEFIDCSIPPHQLQLLSHSNKAASLSRQGKHKEAFASASTQTTLAEDYAAKDIINDSQLSVVYANTAWYAILAGEYVNAEVFSRKAIKNDATKIWMESNLAHALLFQGKFDEALVIYIQHVDQELNDGRKWQDTIEDDFTIFTKADIFHDKFPAVLAHISLKVNGLSRNENNKTILYFRKALATDIKSYGEDHSKVAIARKNLGEALQKIGEFEKAIGYYKLALRENLNPQSEEHLDVIDIHKNLGLSFYSLGNYDSATEQFAIVLTYHLKKQGENHLKVAEAHNRLGISLLKNGRYDKALTHFEKALSIHLHNHSETHTSVAISRNNVGKAWLKKGRYKKAIEYLEPAVASLNDNLGAQHATTKWVAKNLTEARRLINEIMGSYMVRPVLQEKFWS